VCYIKFLKLFSLASATLNFLAVDERSVAFCKSYSVNVRETRLICVFSVTASQVKAGLLCVSLKRELFCQMTNVTLLVNQRQIDLVIRLNPVRVNVLTGAGTCQNGARLVSCISICFVDVRLWY